MDFSSLPQFPSTFRAAAPTHSPRKPLSLRVATMLFCLVAASATALMLYALWPSINALAYPSAPVPLDFRLIEQKYGYVRQTHTTASELVQLLGPPSSQEYEGPGDFTEIRRFHPDRYPDFKSQVWLRWADPNDKGKWVVVHLLDGKVYQAFKHGF